MSFSSKHSHVREGISVVSAVHHNDRNNMVEIYAKLDEITIGIDKSANTVDVHTAGDTDMKKYAEFCKVCNTIYIARHREYSI